MVDRGSPLCPKSCSQSSRRRHDPNYLVATSLFARAAASGIQIWTSNQRRCGKSRVAHDCNAPAPPRCSIPGHDTHRQWATTSATRPHPGTVRMLPAVAAPRYRRILWRRWSADGSGLAIKATQVPGRNLGRCRVINRARILPKNGSFPACILRQ